MLLEVDIYKTDVSRYDEGFEGNKGLLLYHKIMLFIKLHHLVEFLKFVINFFLLKNSLYLVLIFEACIHDVFMFQNFYVVAFQKLF